MPKATVICYLSSLLFYGMGYSKMGVLNSGHVSTYDYTINVSLATAYFVLTIFLIVIGSVSFYIKTIKNHQITEINNIKYRVKAGRGSDNRRRADTPAVTVRAQLSHYEYGVDLERRMSS